MKNQIVFTFIILLLQSCNMPQFPGEDATNKKKLKVTKTGLPDDDGLADLSPEKFEAPEESDFFRVVEAKCLLCHTANNIPPNLQQSISKYIESGLILPGTPLESKVYYRLKHSRGSLGDKNMPPVGSFTEQEAELVYNFIANLKESNNNDDDEPPVQKTPSPEIVIKSKTFYNDIYVNIMGKDNTHIRYSVDGSELDNCDQGIAYSGPVKVSQKDTILKAIACENDIPSMQVQETYTFYTQAPPLAPSLSINSKVYKNDFFVTISSNAQSIRYSIGSDINNCYQGQLYTGQLKVSGRTQHLYAIACDNYGQNSSSVSAIYTYDNIPPAVPSYSPNITTFSKSLDITLISDNDANIKYKLNGQLSSCSEGINYASPIKITNLADTTIYAIACDQYGNMSSNKKIELKYDPLIINPPSISPVSKKFNQNFLISLSGNDKIIYKFNSAPANCNDGTLYSSPFNLPANALSSQMQKTKLFAITCVGSQKSNSITEEYTYDSAPPAKPSFSVASKDYKSPFQLSLSSDIGAIIRYSLDGSNISNCQAGMKYTGPISISGKNQTVKAISCDELSNKSVQSIATYKYDNTAPNLTIVTPTNADITTNSFVARGACESGGTKVKVSFTGQSALIDCVNNQYMKNFSVDYSMNGDHSFVAEQSDLLANKSIKQVNFKINISLTSQEYEEKTLALISNKCLSCHTSLGSWHEYDIQKFVDTGLIIPGDPLNSKLYYRLKYSKGTLGRKTMPTSGNFSESDTQLIYDLISNVTREPASIDPPDAPKILTSGRTYLYDFKVTIEGSTELIKYNVDGSELKDCDQGITYSAPITISKKDTVLKAIACKEDIASTPVSETYIFYNLPPPNAPTVSVNSKTYKDSFNVTINSSANSIQYSLQSPINSCSQGQRYVGPLNISGKTQSLYAIACDTYGQSSPMIQKTYTYDNTPPSVPTYSPNITTFSRSTDISLASDNNAIIRYQFNNPVSGCSTGTKYIAPISISELKDTIIYSIACDIYGNASTNKKIELKFDPLVITAPQISPLSKSFNSNFKISISSEDKIIYKFYSPPANCEDGNVYTVPFSLPTSAMSQHNKYTPVFAISCIEGQKSAAVQQVYHYDILPPATPSYSVTSKTYKNSFAVSLSSDAGANIRYTINGDNIGNCSSGLEYKGPITISGKTTTLKALSCDEINNKSQQVVQTYNYDNIPPNISIASLAGQTITGASLVAQGACESSTQQVKITFNNQTFQVNCINNSFNKNINLTYNENGAHTLKVEQSDIFGNHAIKQVNFNIAIALTQQQYRDRAKGVITNHCLTCHGTNGWGEFTDEDFINEGLIIPGDSANSKIVKRLKYSTSADRSMPPSFAPTYASFSTQDQQAIIEWIDNTDAVVPQKLAPANKKMLLMTKKYIKNTLFNHFNIAIEEDDMKYQELSYGLGKSLLRAETHSLSYFQSYFKFTEELVNNNLKNFVHGCIPKGLNHNCITSTVIRVGKLLFRRDLTDTEVTYYRNFAKAQGFAGFKQGTAYAIISMLNSPEFLYIPLYGNNGQLTGPELASKLSIVLLGSNPDMELIDAGANGSLLTPSVYAAQVDRILNNESKAAHLFFDFFKETWKLNLVDETPTAEFYPELTGLLEKDLLKEFELTSKDIYKSNNGDWRKILNNRYTFVNKNLAEHYSLGPVPSDNSTWQKVAMPETRSGLLTSGIMMAAHSGNKYTSTTHRGLFLINELLCNSISSPSKPLSELIDEAGIEFSDEDTVHERIEKLGTTQPCMSCHVHFDPYGLVFENYDNFGKYYEMRHGESVFSTSQINDQVVENAPELAELLISDSSKLSSCMMKKIYNYSTGLSEGNGIDLEQIHGVKTEDTRFNFRAIMRSIVTHENFKKALANE